MKLVRRTLCILSALVFFLSFPLAHEAQADAGENAREIVADMSLRDKITQLLFVDFRGWMTLSGEETISRIAQDPQYAGEPVTQMNGEIARMLQEYRFGGVILFSENLRNTEASVRLVRDIQRAAISKGGLPLFMGVDQEGGNITRLGQGTCLPGNMAIGAAGQTEYAYQAGALIARELDAIGLNINFSPVADVNDNPENPIINLRSFGSDPNTVAGMAVRMAQGIQSAGVLAVGKHFPGHGNTSSDSHTSLPRIEKDLEALRGTELKPFQALIDAGIQMMMCAHIQFPALDNSTFRSMSDGREVVVPATFSRAILTDLLRAEMGFDGLIITDAMNMDAVAKHVAPADAVIRALAAGVDILLMPVKLRSPADAVRIEEIILAVENALQMGSLSLSELDASVERVVRLKIQTGLLDETFSKTGDESAVHSALEIVGGTAHRKIEREIAQAAITLVRDELSVLPFKPGSGDTVLVITPYANETASARFAMNQLKAEGIVPEGVILETFSYKGKNLIEEDLGAMLKRANCIILQTEMSGAASLMKGHWITDLPLAVWDYVKTAGMQNRIVHASIGAPFDIVNYEEFPAQLLSFGCVGMSEADADSGVITGKYGPNLLALLGAVFGAFTPNGGMPVNVK